MKSIKKKLAILLCVCLVWQTNPISYAAMQMATAEQTTSNQNPEIATSSDILTTVDSEDEDEDWTERDGELLDDRMTPSNASATSSSQFFCFFFGCEISNGFQVLF